MSAGPVPVDFNAAVFGRSRGTFAQVGRYLTEDAAAALRSSGNMGRIIEVPLTSSLSDLVATLRHWIEQHVALRTNLEVTPGGDYVQHVARSGVVWLDTFLLGSSSSREETLRELMLVPFERAEEWPVRCSVGIEGGRPSALALCFSHAVLDGASVDILVERLGLYLEAGGTPSNLGCLTDRNPLDQADVEASWHEKAIEALEYWSLQRARCQDIGVPPGAHTALEPRWRDCTIRSEALVATLRVLASRYKSTTPAVLLAAAALYFSRSWGHDRFACTYLSGNRIDTALTRYVGILSQGVVLTIDTLGVPFEVLTQTALVASVEALMAGHYDPLRVRGLWSKGEGAGHRPVVLPFVNIVVSGNESRSDPPPPSLSADDAADDAVFEWSPGLVWHDLPLVLEIVIDHATTSCEVRLIADTCLMSLDEMEGCLKGITAFLSAVAAMQPTDDKMGFS